MAVSSQRNIRRRQTQKSWTLSAQRGAACSCPHG